MFVGRESELKKLNKMYAKDSFEFAIIYGRRRVGKTTLINEFLKDKKAIYFTGVEENAANNLARFSKAILSFEDKENPVEASFKNFDEAFSYLAKNIEKERLVLVIDEYPFLAKASPAVSSILQYFIDHHFLQSKLFLILCGSSMSFMENQVLGYQSPLYGRRTRQFKIKPFNFDETCEYFPKLDKETAFTLHAITGGIPRYLSLINTEETLRENISDSFLTPDAYLFEEPSNLLKQELRNPINYNSIITAIAEGASKQNDIATKTQIPSSTITSYLRELIALGIVEKIVPITEIDKPKTKRTLYRIADGMFRFWHTFIPKNIDFIEQEIDIWLAIEKEIPHFLAANFEELSRDYLWKHYDDTSIVPTPFQRIGLWWGTDDKTRKEVEIDIVGHDFDGLVGYFGECKWSKNLVGVSTLEKLIKNSELFYYPTKHLYLFAKTGFTKECRELAEKVGCRLVTFAEM
ncbi:MAG: ATP-binding protein [Micrococcaceae bacterium]